MIGKILSDEINTLAQSTWQPKANYMWSEWCQHWHRTAESLAVRYEEQGLHQTAAAIRIWNNQNRSYYNGSDFMVDVTTNKVIHANETHDE